MSQSVEEIQETVRKAAAAHAPLCIKGRGTWTSAYRHVSAAQDLSLWNYAGVQEYVPGNLTMTVRAGTTLGEIAEIAGAENQWLPLDPFGDSAGTIGGTVATGSYGPLVTAFGAPRDLVLGVEAVLGSGELVRGGGRVVKNVAGYDLSRLFTGSWGTLGAITEVTVRLFAKQTTDVTIAVALLEKREAAQKMIQGIQTGQFQPWAMELLDRQLSRALGITLADEAVLLVRFGGTDDLVLSQLDKLQIHGSGPQVETEVWKNLTRFQHGWSMRLSGLPSKFFDTWDAAAQLVGTVGSGFRSGTPERGVVRIFFPEQTDSGRLFTAFGQFAASRARGLKIIVEAMPSVSPLAGFDADRSVTNDLSSKIKRVFDPTGVLNPGFLQQ